MSAPTRAPPSRRRFLLDSGRLLAGLLLLGGTGASAQTFHDRRFEGVLRQEYDMSCGIASVRTLLAVLGIDPPDEQVLIAERLNAMTTQEATRTIERGFSIADLGELLAAHGVQAVAVRGQLRQLLSVDRMSIVHLRTRDGEHFAVLQGLRSEDGRLVLLDPARGRLALAPYQFEAEWSGIALVVVSTRVGSPEIRLDPSRRGAADTTGALHRVMNPVVNPQVRP